MPQKTSRLFFLDTIRAFAIIMMLQGHFIDGLLDPEYKKNPSILLEIWSYFRGVTAPLFFSISGLIFTFLLLKPNTASFKENKRVFKGLKRALQLIGIGYLLRLHVPSIFIGKIYPTFYQVDVLHCIGFSIIVIIGLYGLFFHSQKMLWALFFILGSCVFLLEPIYQNYDFNFLPLAIANYFTKANGSVFTIVPWVGYTLFGASIAGALHYYQHKKHFYPILIGTLISAGIFLTFYSANFFLELFYHTRFPVFLGLKNNNYLFIRLGDSFLLLAFFIGIRKIPVPKNILLIGQNTLTIYVIHYIILYGGVFGIGLYRFLHHNLSIWQAAFGAIAFIIITLFLEQKYRTTDLEKKNRIVNKLQKI